MLSSRNSLYFKMIEKQINPDSKARDYDPTIGRWTTKDPIGFAGGDTNLYAYVGGNPMSYNDPEGQFALPLVIGIVAGVFYATPTETEGAATDELIGVPLSVVGGAGICKTVQGYRRLPKSGGFEVRFSKDFRFGWHRLPDGRNLPHYHRRPGIGKHRPWEGGF